MSERDSGCVVWMTGLPGAGKTTIAERLAEILRDRGRRVEIMDGDEIRRGLSADLGFSKEDRSRHADRVGFVSKLLSRNGVVVLVALISPYREFRARVREDIPEFVEVYVDAPLEVCIARDPKGLYAKALAGEISDLTGIQDPYEAPESPEVRVSTDRLSVDECCSAIVEQLAELGHVPREQTL